MKTVVSKAPVSDTPKRRKRSKSVKVTKLIKRRNEALVSSTRRVWSKLLGHDVGTNEALEIILGVQRLIHSLSEWNVDGELYKATADGSYRRITKPKGTQII